MRDMGDDIKICFLVHDLDPKAGWGRYSLEIIGKIRGQLPRSIVLSERESGMDYEKGLLGNSMGNPFFVFFNAWRIRSLIKKCDIIHCFDGYPYGVIGALANIGLKKKLIINGVGTYSVAPLRRGTKSLLLKWAYRQADTITCISRFTCEEIKKKIPDLKNLTVVNLGVDSQKFKIENEKLKITNQNEKSEKIILSVGALKHRKGYHVSIPAVGLAKEKFPDLKYFIVGDQSNIDYLNELKELVRKYELENNVVFMSNLSDDELAELYNQADLFLLTSVNKNDNFEGFGLVYLEASACGKPTIGTYGCGAEDAIDNGQTGFLVEQENPQKTAEAILTILNNQALAQQMGVRGQEKAGQMSWDRTIDGYLSIYRSLLTTND